MADSYFSYSVGYSSYRPTYSYHHGHYLYRHRHRHYYGYPYRYGRRYWHHRNDSIFFVFRRSTYARSPIWAAPKTRLQVVRVVGAPDPSLAIGYGDRARIDCKPTTGTGRVNGREAMFGGTFCYDALGRGYIVPGSQHFIGYAD